MRSHAQHLVVLAALLFLSGCQQLGLAEPQGFRDRLAYGYSQNAAIRTSAAQALTAKAITKEDAQHVLSITDSVRVFLDSARAINEAAGGSAPSTALEKLQLATGLLGQVRTFLTARGVK